MGGEGPGEGSCHAYWWWSGGVEGGGAGRYGAVGLGQGQEGRGRMVDGFFPGEDLVVEIVGEVRGKVQGKRVEVIVVICFTHGRGRGGGERDGDGRAPGAKRSGRGCVEGRGACGN